MLLGNVFCLEISKSTRTLDWTESNFQIKQPNHNLKFLRRTQIDSSLNECVDVLLYACAFVYTSRVVTRAHITQITSHKNKASIPQKHHHQQQQHTDTINKFGYSCLIYFNMFEMIEFIRINGMKVFSFISCEWFWELVLLFRLVSLNIRSENIKDDIWI